jgi:hypothetical protein
MAATTQPKPQNDAYTGILFISLLALLGACALLYMDYEQYGARTPPKGGQLETPKALEKGMISPTIPLPAPVNEPKKAEPGKNEPTTMNPPVKPRETEVTSVRPQIQAPPTVPAAIPTLQGPGLPPVPVLTSDEGKVVPAKFETIAPTKLIADPTPHEVSKPSEPMKELEPLKAVEEPKPSLELKPLNELRPAVPVTPSVRDVPAIETKPAVPTAPPSLEDGPPVIRPFVPGK